MKHIYIQLDETNEEAQSKIMGIAGSFIGNGATIVGIYDTHDEVIEVLEEDKQEEYGDE